jgi:hypothetical protein
MAHRQQRVSVVQWENVPALQPHPTVWEAARAGLSVCGCVCECVQQCWETFMLNKNI